MVPTRKVLALVNLFIVIAVIAWNYTANTAGIKGNTVSSLSAVYYNLFTPAGYAFSIWGLIFIGLLALTIFMVRRAFNGMGDDDFISQIGPWLIIANIGNACWLFVWLNELTAISVLVMLIILIALIMCIVRLNMERWDAPAPIIVFVWWPLCTYSGWIAVATIANIAAYLSKIGWHQAFSDVTWTVIMIVVAVVLNWLMVYTRNMREFASVGIWALVAIAVRHWTDEPTIKFVSLAGATFLFIVVAIHGYRNRLSSPFIKRKIRS